jgi:hypothetical protein
MMNFLAVFPQIIQSTVANLIDEIDDIDEEIVAKKRKYVQRLSYCQRRVRNKRFMMEEIPLLSDFELTRTFRLSRSAFYYLLSLIRDQIDNKPIHLRGHTINERPNLLSPEAKLALTLRWLAGCQFVVPVELTIV